MSVGGAFDLAERCLELNVCGPELLFIAGHLSPFIGLLEYFADDEQCRAYVSRIAVLPFVAYASLFRRSDDLAATLNFYPYVEQAQKLLGETAWPTSAFRGALERFEKRSPLSPVPDEFALWPLEQAYRIALKTPSLDAAADLVLPFIAEWAAAFGGWSSELEELVKAYETLFLERRSLYRRNHIPKEKLT
jgi:hypothetical protein